MTRRDAGRSQPYWAARVVALGNGAAHDCPTPTTRVAVSRAQDDPDLRDPRASDRRGRHDPHRRGDDEQRERASTADLDALRGNLRTALND
jgi:hypothetical protein